MEELGSSSGSIPPVNAQVGPRNVAGGVREEVYHSAHKVFRLAHVASRDERCPVLIELWVVFEDFGGTMFY